MNPADIAQENELLDWVRHQEEAIHEPDLIPSALSCEDCDIAIPPDRREAQPGCTRCAQCQTDYESLKKRGLVA